MSALLFIILFFLMAIGVPIAFCIELSGAGFLAITKMKPLILVAQRLMVGMDSFPLLAVPLFICTGYIMESTSMSTRLVECVESYFGRIRGSMGIVTIISCTIFAALTGSGPATVAAIGSIMLPALMKSGYPRHVAAGIIAGGGALGPIIPPSVAMIVYGSTMNVSIPKMFIGSIIPGLLMSVMLIVTNQILTVKMRLTGNDTRVPLREKLQKTWKAAGTLVLPVIILGGIYGGIFTPTEAAVVSTVYSLLLSLAYRELTWRSVLKVFEKTIETSSTVILILGVSGLFAWLLTITRIPNNVSAYVITIVSSKTVYLLVLTLLLFVVGTLMEALVSIVILGPIVVPIGLALGVDPLHLGCLFCINLIVGFITPPFGVNLYTAVSTTKVSYSEVVRGTFPFMLALMVGVLLITYIPQLVLWLPGIMFG